MQGHGFELMSHLFFNQSINQKNMSIKDGHGKTNCCFLIFLKEHHTIMHKHFLRFILFVLYLRAFMCIMCMQEVAEIRREHQDARTVVSGSCEHLCKYWELNLQNKF